jgi:hypothetical protein
MDFGKLETGFIRSLKTDLVVNYTPAKVLIRTHWAVPISSDCPWFSW